MSNSKEISIVFWQTSALRLLFALKGWFPYDRRRSRIADRRSQKVLRSSAIIWKPTSAIVCDRLRSCDRDRRRSQKIEPCSIFCDILRSSAIVCDPAIIWKPKFCDRNVSHNNVNPDSNDSTLLSNKA